MRPRDGVYEERFLSSAKEIHHAQRKQFNTLVPQVIPVLKSRFIGPRDQMLPLPVTCRLQPPATYGLPIPNWDSHIHLMPIIAIAQSAFLLLNQLGSPKTAPWVMGQQPTMLPPCGVMNSPATRSTSSFVPCGVLAIRPMARMHS